MAKSCTIGISSLQQRSGGLGEVRSKSKAKANSNAKAGLRLRLKAKANIDSHASPEARVTLQATARAWDDPSTSFSPWGSAAAGGSLVNMLFRIIRLFLNLYI